jgi:glycosyltransferase involved in cell wall biosynthesis
MAMNVPVLAYAAGAVPETLGGAGVLFRPKDLEYAAELLGALAYDRGLRREVVDGQRQRLAVFDEPALLEAIDRMLGPFTPPRTSPATGQGTA